VEITVIDDSDHVGWAASATRFGEVYMTDVASMVTNVLAKAKTKRISRLNVLDHGNEKSLQVGTDRISEKSLAKYETQLQKLNGRFAPNGFVHLQHCKIGKNWVLLARIAKIVGVPVIAGEGYQNPVYRFNTGDYVKCLPSGACFITDRP
jgi:hypothetical protein